MYKIYSSIAQRIWHSKLYNICAFNHIFPAATCVEFGYLEEECVKGHEGVIGVKLLQA